MINAIAFFARPVSRFATVDVPDANKIILRKRHAH